MAETAETLALIDRHWRALTTGDLAALIADYAEDAVLITGATGITTGRAAIGELLAMYCGAILPAASTRFVLDKTLAAGPLGLIVWSAESPTHSIVFGTDTFVVVDGRIAHQTSAGVVETR
jgi:ketosteroid isomerase-like protein